MTPRRTTTADTAPYPSSLKALLDRETAHREDVRDHETRVATTSVALARDIGMNAADIEVLALAARIHDIGKIKVATAILRKPGRLEDREWDQMRRHALLGAQMLSKIPGLPPIMIEIARYHHERYDGFGYEGLKGEAIPYMARIVAIADTHDALIAKRDYKPEIPEDEALRIMVSDTPSPGFGRRGFDPVLLRRFVAMRLNDPHFTASEANRVALSDFVASDPVNDLPHEARGSVRFGKNGQRFLYSGNDDGILVKTISLDGRISDYGPFDAEINEEPHAALAL